MLIGYMRVSKTDGSQTTDLQHDALIAAGVAADHIYEDRASGKLDARPGLDAALKSLREGDTLVVWKLVFGIFAALAEFERELISERTKAGLASARARGRSGGAPYKMTVAKLRLAMAAMGQPETTVGDLCNELGITRQTLYRHVDPDGNLRDDGQKLLAGRRK